MATDAEIRAQGINFLSPQKYLQNPYELPTNTPVVEETESFGIPNTNSFTNSGGNNYTGGFNQGDFQNIVDARQRNLNKPTDTSTFMGRTMGKIGDFINPQSASQIMDEGYQEPRFQPGIMATIMGKMDNYRNLPRADQAFIAQNMGYTGPTVFGENTSGLGKDPFGINTRSAFGNYGEYVGNAVTDLEKALGKARGKYKTEEEYLDMTKLMRRKLDFYRGKKIEKQTIIDNKKAADLKAFEDQKARSGTTSGANDGRYENINDRNRGGQGAFQEDKTSMKSAGKSYQDAKGNVGYSRGRKDGGRIGYFFGGRVNYRDGGLASIL